MSERYMIYIYLYTYQRISSRTAVRRRLRNVLGSYPGYKPDTAVVAVCSVFGFKVLCIRGGLARSLVLRVSLGALKMQWPLSFSILQSTAVCTNLFCHWRLKISVVSLKSQNSIETLSLRPNP